MNNYFTLSEEIVNLAQRNQAQLGPIHDMRLKSQVNLNSRDLELLDNLTQTYTDVIYKAFDLSETASQTDRLNLLSIINARLNQITSIIQALKGSSSPELVTAIEKIRHGDLQNKIKELDQIVSIELRGDKKILEATSGIQTATAGNSSNRSKSSAPANNLNGVKPPEWGIKFTVTEVNRDLISQLREPRNVSDPRRKREVEPYYMGPAAPSGKSFYMTLLPAMASHLNLQGARDVPNAMPGLNFKIIPSIAKLKVPGFQPIYQNLGIDTVLCTIVGCFTGADGISEIKNGTELPINKTQDFKGQLLPYQGNRAFFKNGSDEASLKAVISQLDSYRNFQEFYQMTILEGKEVKVEINLAKSSGATIIPGEDKNLRSGTGNAKFQAVIKNMEIYHSRSDRTWYTIQLEITNFGLASKTPINLTNKLTEKIKAAQALQKAQEAQKANTPEGKAAKEAEDFLKNVKGEKYDLKDGRSLFKGEECAKTDLIASVCKERWFLKDSQSIRELTNLDEINKLKEQRTGQPSIGDMLSLLSGAVGCGYGLGTTVTAGVGAVLSGGTGTGAAVVKGGLTAVSCGLFANEFHKTFNNKAEGKSIGEGVLDLGLNLVVPAAPNIGKAGMNALRGLKKSTPPVIKEAAETFLKLAPEKASAIVNSTTGVFPKVGNFIQRSADKLNPKNYSIFNKNIGTPSTTSEVLNTAGQGSTFIGPLGKTGANVFKNSLDFINESNLLKKDITGSVVTLKNGQTLNLKKITNVSQNGFLANTSSGLQNVRNSDIQSIRLMTGETWKLP